MNAKHWLQVVTIAAALAMGGTAVADDGAKATSTEQAGAAMNGNLPAQMGTNVDSNSAAQLGADTPKATVPSDSDAPTATTGDDTARQTMKHPPTNRMDQATPTEKTPSGLPAAKHPPTARMDAATPVEKSPKAAE